uniref:Protein kinase domain-containing protein n=1 Tax=Peronospora matthiolae TaxID=2874970 RepID=A0AAV1VL14_9STRA
MTLSPKDTITKPSINEFKQGKTLGEGNFSRIVEVQHKVTGETFALKIIDKQRIKRLRVRHPNVFNEINMEKDALNRLRHPNIIRLYQTFQDESNLYFLLELLNGGELLNQLIHEGRQLGLTEDLARFYLADVVNAVEYMHANQMLHRDLKPENIMICGTVGGHLKLIDFGTAKHFADKKLDGPNFVGTPEYMAPETIKNKYPTYASDMWAFGCIAYQLLTGETPFGGGSAYLTFLHVQNGSFDVPDYLSPEARDLIDALLQKDPANRLGGTRADAMSAVKAHPFFRDIDFDNHMQVAVPSSHLCGSELFPLVNSLVDVEKSRSLRHTKDNDGDLVQIQINALSPREKSILMHVLRRKHKLHLPGIYPRFFSSVSRGRCMYACNRGYVGFTHDLQNQWTGNFSFMQLCGPKLGQAAAFIEADDRGGSTWETESKAFRTAIDFVNARRPEFVVICGEFVNSKPSQAFYEAQVTAFQELVSEIIPQTRLVFVAGSDEFDTPSDKMVYEEHFGDARYSFWYGGIKFVVANSTILRQNDEFPDEVTTQTEWMKKELENGKLCARGTVLFSGRSLCSVTEVADTSNGSNSEHALTCVEISEQLRAKYWEMIRNGQVCLVSSGSSNDNGVASILTKADGEEADEYKCEIVSCQLPWRESSSIIHCTEVTEDGVLTTACHVESSRSLSL